MGLRDFFNKLLGRYKQPEKTKKSEKKKEPGVIITSDGKWKNNKPKRSFWEGENMMSEMLHKDETIGKTIKSVVFSDINGQMIIVFTDNTFTTFGIERSYEPGNEDIKSEELSLFDFGDKELIELGIITKEALERRKGIEDRKWEREVELREKQHLAKLKEKYE